MQDSNAIAYIKHIVKLHSKHFNFVVLFLLFCLQILVCVYWHSDIIPKSAFVIDILYTESLQCSKYWSVHTCTEFHFTLISLPQFYTLILYELLLSMYVVLTFKLYVTWRFIVHKEYIRVFGIIFSAGPSFKNCSEFV